MAARRALHLALIPGDGVGREVIPAAQRVLEALSTSTHLRFTFTELPAGFGTFQETGQALPQRTLDVLKYECHGALFGAVSSPSTPTPGYSSPIVALRKQLDLYGNVRPVRSVAPRASTTASASAQRPVDLVIVRENTEDLYVKEERTFPDPAGRAGIVAEATKRITERASRRIAQLAGDLALRRASERATLGLTDAHKHPQVTIAHKSNVLPHTDGLFRRVAREALAAAPYGAPSSSSSSSSSSASTSTSSAAASSSSLSSTSSSSSEQTLQVSEQIIDSLFYKLFLAPWQYDVIVAPNLYGDLLSDAAAALVGSLGLVPSANVGDDFVVGEPCHGSAPDIAGQNIANPIAAIRSAALLLSHLGELEAATRIEKAVDDTLADNEIKTPDLGGTNGTTDVTDEILRRL